MRFRFCGDLEPPDWLLSEITILSGIENIQFKTLCKEIIFSILSKEFNYVKFLSPDDSLKQRSNLKASIAAVDFIIREAAKHDVDEDSLSMEIQQLGLPKENAESLSCCYRSNKDMLRKVFTEESLKLPSLKNINWRVDYLLSIKKVDTLHVPSVQLALDIDTLLNNRTKRMADLKEDSSLQTVLVELDVEKFKVLYRDLQAAKVMLDTLE